MNDNYEMTIEDDEKAADLLLSYYNLYTSGILTEEEYKEKKDFILFAASNSESNAEQNPSVQNETINNDTLEISENENSSENESDVLNEITEEREEKDTENKKTTKKKVLFLLFLSLFIAGIVAIITGIILESYYSKFSYDTYAVVVSANSDPTSVSARYVNYTLQYTDNIGNIYEFTVEGHHEGWKWGSSVVISYNPSNPGVYMLASQITSLSRVVLFCVIIPGIVLMIGSSAAFVIVSKHYGGIKSLLPLKSSEKDDLSSDENDMDEKKEKK